MNDRLADLQGRLQRSRAALDALVQRAGAVRGRLEQLATPPALPALHVVEDHGEDGDLVSDAWEIALINEEGK